uniref:Hypothetical_protein n=1 Tax=Oryza glaberrima TaxID=4538 RepID=G2XLK0_ORYGL|nr:hypothetical_protein [Oryza glaberrima]
MRRRVDSARAPVELLAPYLGDEFFDRLEGAQRSGEATTERIRCRSARHRQVLPALMPSGDDIPDFISDSYGATRVSSLL